MAWPDLSDWSFWEHLGRIAPIITAAIAFGAATLALVSLRTQVDIARKRAAIDVFLKTEGSFCEADTNGTLQPVPNK
jgi:cbb3-type cytochrome oxidase subunit 1